MGRLLSLTTVCIFGLTLFAAAAEHRQRSLDEYQIKAAYLVNFARYVHWRTHPGGDGPLRLCVLGDDPFGPALDSISGKRIQDRALVIARYRRVALLRHCHLVFVSRSEAGRLDLILQTLAGQPVLSVSDLPEFTRAGGIIGFITRQRRVRFEVNTAAARRSGIELSSRLLRSAVIVDGGDGP